MSKTRKNFGSDIDRSQDRIDNTGEVFTPAHVVDEMLSHISVETLKNPESTFLDVCAGSGNFLYHIKQLLLEYHAEEHILNNMLYCIEFMEDNHKELCERMGVPVDHPHYVCGDALTYDYSFGEAVGLEAFF